MHKETHRHTITTEAGDWKCTAVERNVDGELKYNLTIIGPVGESELNTYYTDMHYDPDMDRLTFPRKGSPDSDELEQKLSDLLMGKNY